MFDRFMERLCQDHERIAAGYSILTVLSKQRMTTQTISSH